MTTKTKNFRPTDDECRIIRKCAEKSAGFKRVEINPGTRFNLRHPNRGDHMNICLCFAPGENASMGGTDLADNAFTWSYFRKGFPLQDGRAIVDFWVYNTGPDAELQTNVTTYWERARLIRIEGVGNGIMWEAEDVLQPIEAEGMMLDALDGAALS
jgi:hypothetical protein